MSSKFDDYDFPDEQLRQAKLATGNPYLQDLSKAMGLLARLCGRPDGTTADEVAGRLASLKELVHEDFPEVVEQSDYQGEARAYDELLRMERELEELALFPDLATRHVIGVGGSFSAGKSRFLNTLLDIDLLPEDVRPTTAVPTYLVTGSERDDIEAINTFSRRISLSTDELEALSHEFGSAHGQGAQLRLAELLKYLLVRRHADGWNRLAFLDTPGYSKAESSDEATADKAVAQTQLASADHLLWLLDTANGSIRQDDIDFLLSLQHTGELFVVLTHADLLSKSQAEQVAQIVRKRLNEAGLTIQGLMAWSAPPGRNYGERVLGDDVRPWLDNLNQKPKLTNKRNKLRSLFSGYIDHHRERVEETQMSLRVFNALSPWHREMDSTLRDDLGKMRRTQQEAQRLNRRLIRALEKLRGELVEQVNDLVGGEAVADAAAPCFRPTAGSSALEAVCERDQEVRSVVFSPDGEFVASAGEGGSIEIWSTKRKERAATIQTDDDAQSIDISPDGTYLVSGGSSGWVKCWSMPDGAFLAEEKHAAYGSIVDVAFSPTGKEIVLAAGGPASRSIRRVRNALAGVRRATDGGTLSCVYVAVTSDEPLLGPISAVAASPDGDVAASAHRDGSVAVWVTSSLDEIAKLEKVGASEMGLCFSPDGRFLAIGTASGGIQLFPAVPLLDFEQVGREITTPSNQHRGTVRSITFSRDGRWLVSGGEDGAVKVWNMTDSSCVTTFSGHDGPVTSLAFSPDGLSIASGGADHTLRLWRVPRG